MQLSDFIAALALLVSGGALALEIRRWFEAGPKIHISLIADAVMMPDDGQGDRLAITVYNRGGVPTTVTHMIVFAMHPRWQFWRRQKDRMLAGVVNTVVQPIPHELGINQRWMGMMRYDDRTNGFRQAGQLYVGVLCSHSSREYLVRVPPKKAEDAKQELPG